MNKAATVRTEQDFLLISDRLDLSEYPFDNKGAELIEAERQIPVVVSTDTSIRPKILDACGMSCVFCHNEGTPVAQAHSGVIGLPNPRYRQGRVSVFAETNGVDFLPGQMFPDDNFRFALNTLKENLQSDEVHFTGGEPSLHPALPGLIGVARETGYDVKITSNGENLARHAAELAQAGLRKVNFSIFGTTPQELADVQHDRFRASTHLAAAKITALQRSIAACLDNRIKADANIVVPDVGHTDRVQRLIHEYDERLSVRILNDIDGGNKSYFAVYSLLAQLGAEPVETMVSAGSSNSRVKYRTPEGRELYFKQIRRTVLPETCSSCHKNNDNECKEGYYGVRLYVDQTGQYKVGVCLQRMDLTANLEDFVRSGIPQEIVALRSLEAAHMRDYFGSRISNE